MQKIVLSIGAVFTTTVSAICFSETSIAQGGADGKKIFLDQKCNSCHSITAQGIPVKQVEGEEKNEKDPPDLSALGLERNADWIAKYLMKKESIKGEKHPKKFKGNEADLTAISQYLESQKTKPKK